MFAAAEQGLEDGTLLFEPQGPVVLRNAALTVTYEESRDYRLDPAGRHIVRTETSRIPAMREGEISGATAAVIQQHLTVVSYVHGGDPWTGFVPPNCCAQLPRVSDRLHQRQPVSLCVLGDSIAEGYDATGFHRMPPECPPFWRLAGRALEARFGAPVELNNYAVAGSTSENGRWVAAEAAARAPDLVMIAFGMNDACYAEADEFTTHIADIIDRVRRVSGESEFLLVSPMRPTPACTWVSQERFGQYRDALSRLTGSGVALADVTRLWDAVLARKRPRDLSGNGSNHPNDFGHRLYAHAILATMGCDVWT